MGKRLLIFLIIPMFLFAQEKGGFDLSLNVSPQNISGAIGNKKLHLLRSGDISLGINYKDQNVLFFVSFGGKFETTIPGNNFQTIVSSTAGIGYLRHILFCFEDFNSGFYGVGYEYFLFTFKHCIIAPKIDLGFNMVFDDHASNSRDIAKADFGLLFIIY